MKVKAISVLAMIGIVTLSIVVSAYPTDHPYISNVIPPGGTHAPGETVKFTVKIINPTDKSFTTHLALITISPPPGYRNESDGDDFTIPPRNMAHYTIANLSIPLYDDGYLIPGSYKVLITMADFLDSMVILPSAFNVSSTPSQVTPETETGQPTPPIMDPATVHDTVVFQPEQILPLRR
jgi:hypothetical protein